MTVTSPLQLIDSSPAYHWAASGNDGPDPDADTGRLLTAAWIGVRGAPSIISLIRSMSYDAKTKQLVTYPVEEYEKLRNETFAVDKAYWPLAANSTAPLPVPPNKGGAADILISFNLSAGQAHFGLSVRSGDVMAEVTSVD
eukprot:SAG31_NODE_9480_length_1270_cov_1.712212_3_plen_140_part_01